MQFTNRQGLLRLAVLLALACAVAGFGLAWYSQAQAGLSPTTSAWAATVAALLAYQGFHVVILVLVAGFLCARSWANRLLPSHRVTLDNCSLLWHGTALQGIIGIAIVHLMPSLMA